MVDQRTARPVSGEIMAGPSAGQRTESRLEPRVDMVDADYEVLTDGHHNPAPHTSPVDVKVLPPDGMDMLRGQEGLAAMPAGLSRGGPIFWLFGIVLVLAAFWISGGHSIFSDLVSGTARDTSPVLVVSGVSSRIDVSGPKPVLFVDGEAGNEGSAQAAMPPLEILVTSNDGRIVRYNLGTAGRSLQPGEKFTFSSRLDVPKNGVKTVSVTFAE